MELKERDRVIVNYPVFNVVNEKGTILGVNDYDYPVRLDVFAPYNHVASLLLEFGWFMCGH